MSIYNPHTWVDDELITKNRLNIIENGIYNASSNVVYLEVLQSVDMTELNNAVIDGANVVAYRIEDGVKLYSHSTSENNGAYSFRIFSTEYRADQHSTGRIIETTYVLNADGTWETTAYNYAYITPSVITVEYSDGKLDATFRELQNAVAQGCVVQMKREEVDPSGDTNLTGYAYNRLVWLGSSLGNHQYYTVFNRPGGVMWTFAADSIDAYLGEI